MDIPARARALALLAALALGGAAAAQPIYHPPAGQDFEGVWLIDGDHSTIRTVDGKLPPLKPAAARLYRAHLAARKAGRPAFDTVQSCEPHGLPRILFANFPIEVLQEPRQVTFIHEVHHMPRMVYLDMALPKPEDLDTLWMGVSVGHWEGDTLVVDSAGFNDKTTLDAAGLPHSTGLRLQERWRKLDGDTLEDVITVNDPEDYARPWSTRVAFKRQPGRRIQEYVCTDHNLEAAGQ